MKLRAIILEDELLPRLSLLQKLKEYHPELEVLGDYEDAESALEAILKQRPDVLFLDIQLSGHSSLWLAEQLQNTGVNPYIIFTTAFSDPEYLLKAIKLEAAAYLLKPVNIQELAQALKKVEDKIAKSKEKQLFHDAMLSIRLKTLHSTLVVKPDDVLYCKADGNYCCIFLEDGREEMIFERLGALENHFAGTSIIRAGKSFLVNLQYVYKIDYKNGFCILKSPNNQLTNVELSPAGIEIVNRSLSCR